MRNSVSAWVVVAGGVVVLKVQVNSGSRIAFRCASTLLMYGAMKTRSVAPDTAVGVTQHLGVSPRWLDHLPLGGASGVVAVRRAARAIQAGDAEIVACIAGDTNHVDSFRQSLGSFSLFARDATYPYGSGGPNAMFAFITAHYMRTYGAHREDFGRICVAERENALATPYAMLKKTLSLAEHM